MRAYSDAVREVLAVVPRAIKTPTHKITIACPYRLFETIRRIIEAQEGSIIDEAFGAQVTITAQLPQNALPNLQHALQEVSRGQISADVVESSDSTIVPILSASAADGS